MKSLARIFPRSTAEKLLKTRMSRKKEEASRTLKVKK